MKAAIVGAGLAGLQVARRLSAAGIRVRIFEKARGPSGRLATRRSEAGRFDHGAQYLTARDPRFVEQVEEWIGRGVVARWDARVVELARGKETVESPRRLRYVGVPSMSAIARSLAEDRPIEVGIRIERIEQRGTQWVLSCDAGFDFPGFDLVILAVPAPQAAPLLSGAAVLQAETRLRRMRACHAAMVTFGSDPKTEFDAAFVDDRRLAWAARNDSKPGRDGKACWVLHSTPEWSADHVELPSGDVLKALLSGFSESLGRDLPDVAFAATHRWLYARAEQPARMEPLWDATVRIGACGDWVRGERVEDAFLSAEDLADAVLSNLGGV